MAQEFNMQVAIQDDLDAPEAGTNQELDLDVKLKKFFPTNLTEFRLLDNNFKIAVKAVTDHLVSAIGLTEKEAYASLNAPKNFVTVGILRQKLNNLITFVDNAANVNSPIPVALKLFYN